MHKFSGGPSLAHMRALYGPQVTEQELDATLVPFYKLRDRYRRRFQEDGIAISHEEAVKAYRLVAPLLSEPDPEYAEQRAVMNAITFPCPETGGFGFRIPAVRAILEGFEREIDESSRVLYLKYDGETEARKASEWDRFVAYRSLEFFIACNCKIAERLTGDARSDFERATAILAARTVNRPRGRYDPRLNAPRYSIIAMFLYELQGCGLDVTARSGNPSLASAMASVFNMPERTIRDVWTEAPEIVRSDKSSRSTSDDPLFDPRVPCAQCGCTGRVPVYRTREGGTRKCTDCLEW